jgi:hypothetical protein
VRPAAYVTEEIEEPNFANEGGHILEIHRTGYAHLLVSPDSERVTQ